MNQCNKVIPVKHTQYLSGGGIKSALFQDIKDRVTFSLYNVSVISPTAVCTDQI